MTDRQKKQAAAAAIVLIAAAGFWLWKYVGTSMIRFVSDPGAFREWINGHGPWGRVVFVGMVVFQIIIAVIPGEPFEIAAGYAFGALEGTAISIFAAALGSCLTFGLVRLFGMRLVKVFFSEKQIASVRFLKSNPRRDLLFLIVYMLPGTPKDLLGYFAGLTEIRFPAWLLICSLGRIPSIVTSTIGGDALGTGDYRFAIIVFLATLAISGAGLGVYHWIGKKNSISN